MNVYESLRHDMPELAGLLAQREAVGVATYGVPFTPDKKHDWTPDIEEELGDALVYNEAQLANLRSGTPARVSDNRHAYLCLRHARWHIERAIATVREARESTR